MADDLTLTRGEDGPSDLIGDRYELRRRIGAGGMGEVFEAFDHRLKRLVALKRPPREAWADRRTRDRLAKEAQLQARLEHPHIVSVQDVVDEGLGKPVWVVMKLVRGRSLKDILYERRGLGHVEAASVAVQVGSALRGAHAAGIVHRDLKPSNIMVDANGWAYVLDFGIARVVEQTMVTLTGQQTSGTPLYMAPEQHIGGQAAKDKRVDVFAFGAVLYEMLSGERAFGEAGEPVLAKRERAYTPLSEWAPDCPPALASIVDRCLAPDPAARFGDFSEVEDALRDAVPEVSPPAAPAAVGQMPPASQQHGLAGGGDGNAGEEVSAREDGLAAETGERVPKRVFLFPVWVLFGAQMVRFVYGIFSPHTGVAPLATLAAVALIAIVSGPRRSVLMCGLLFLLAVVTTGDSGVLGVGPIFLPLSYSGLLERIVNCAVFWGVGTSVALGAGWAAGRVNPYLALVVVPVIALLLDSADNLVFLLMVDPTGYGFGVGLLSLLLVSAASYVALPLSRRYMRGIERW